MVPMVASHRRQRAAGQENDFQTRDGRKVWLPRNVAPLHNGRAVARRCLKISYCRMIEGSDEYMVCRGCVPVVHWCIIVGVFRWHPKLQPEAAGAA